MGISRPSFAKLEVNRQIEGAEVEAFCRTALRLSEFIIGTRLIGSFSVPTYSQELGIEDPFLVREHPVEEPRVKLLGDLRIPLLLGKIPRRSNVNTRVTKICNYLYGIPVARQAKHKKSTPRIGNMIPAMQEAARSFGISDPVRPVDNDASMPYIKFDGIVPFVDEFSQASRRSQLALRIAPESLAYVSELGLIAYEQALGAILPQETISIPDHVVPFAVIPRDVSARDRFNYRKKLESHCPEYGTLGRLTIPLPDAVL